MVTLLPAASDWAGTQYKRTLPKVIPLVSSGSDPWQAGQLGIRSVAVPGSTHGHADGCHRTCPGVLFCTPAGDFSCFVFSLHPAAAIYRPSGVNENFQWCGQGFNSLPNGIGFGGQVGASAGLCPGPLLRARGGTAWGA